MLCLVLNGVRVFLCLVSVPSASLAFYLCRVFCVRAPPWLAVRGSRRGWSSPRSACAMRRLARPSSRQPRPRSVRPALRVRPSAPAPALRARPSCLSAFRWCVHLCGAPRAALLCGECPLCSCRLLRFHFVCVLCDTPPRALFVRASRAMFAVVSSRLLPAFPPARARPRARSSRSYALALVPRAFACSFRFASLARGASIDS